MPSPRLALSQMLKRKPNISGNNVWGRGAASSPNQAMQENQLQNAMDRYGVNDGSVWSPTYGRVLYPGSAEYDKATGKNTVNRQASSAAPSSGATGSANTSNMTAGVPSGLSPTDELKAHREKMFQEIDDLKGFYNRPESQYLMNTLGARSRGADAPFSQQVTEGLYANNADASARAHASEQDMIRSRMAASGLGGSGMETSAMINSRRQSQKASRAGRREITSRAALENFQARERAQQQLQGFLGQQGQHLTGATGMGANYRSKLETVQGDVASARAIGAGLAGGGMSNTSSSRVLPQGYNGRATGNPSYGGVTNMGVNVGTFRTKPMQKTSYPQMGLGGSAGPWGALSARKDNMDTSRNTYDAKGSWDPAKRYTGMSESAALDMFMPLDKNTSPLDGAGQAPSYDYYHGSGTGWRDPSPSGNVFVEGGGSSNSNPPPTSWTKSAHGGNNPSQASAPWNPSTRPSAFAPHGTLTPSTFGQGDPLQGTHWSSYLSQLPVVNKRPQTSLPWNPSARPSTFAPQGEDVLQGSHWSEFLK